MALITILRAPDGNGVFVFPSVSGIIPDMNFRRTVPVVIACVLAIACGITRVRASQNTNLITLHIAAFDSHNQPIADLKSEEFQITDEGKAQPIVAFRRNGDAPQLASGRDNKKTPGTNAPLIVILFDLLNANMANRNLAQEEIVQVLEHLESSDSVFLYILTNGGTFYPIHPMPDGMVETPRSTAPWTQQIRPLMKDAVEKVYGLRPIDEQQIGVRIETTYRALDSLTSKMKLNLGWKNLIWITHGIPQDFRSANGELVDDSTRLNRFATDLDHHDIAVSAVMRGSDPTSQDTRVIHALADLTGGTVYDANLEKVISEIQGAARSGYVIQYAAPSMDGKYHKVRVSSSRKGIRIQTKQGYYAVK